MANVPSFNLFNQAGQLSASELRRALREVQRSSHLSVSPPLGLKVDEAGDHLFLGDIDVGFWANIGSEDQNTYASGTLTFSGRYAWLEVFPSTQDPSLVNGWYSQTHSRRGTVLDAAAGTILQNPAYEIHRTTGIAAGTIVWMRRGWLNIGGATAQSQEYVFDYIGTSGSFPSMANIRLTGYTGLAASTDYGRFAGTIVVPPTLTTQSGFTAGGSVNVIAYDPAQIGEGWAQGVPSNWSSQVYGASSSQDQATYIGIAFRGAPFGLPQGLYYFVWLPEVVGVDGTGTPAPNNRNGILTYKKQKIYGLKNFERVGLLYSSTGDSGAALAAESASATVAPDPSTTLAVVDPSVHSSTHTYLDLHVRSLFAEEDMVVGETLVVGSLTNGPRGSSALTVWGESWLDDDTTVVGEFTVGGEATFSSDVTVNAELTTDDLHVINDTTFDGDVDIGGALTVAEPSTFAKRLTITSEGLTVTAGGITVTAGNVSVAAGGVSAASLSATGAVTACTTVTEATGITATAGGITATAGGITATTGNITAASGNIAATSGTVSGTNLTASQVVTAGTGLTVSTGNLAVTTGNLTTGGTVTAATGLVASNGGVTATLGNITASAGNIVASAGGITATLGNIAATAGSISAGLTVTGGTGLVASTGNVTATTGAVSANTTVSAGTGYIIGAMPGFTGPVAGRSCVGGIVV